MDESGSNLDRNKGDIKNIDGFLFDDKTQGIS